MKVGIYGYFYNNYGKTIDYDDNFKKHFKVMFTVYTRDLSQNPIYVKLETVPAIKCTSDHFN
jgi:hypothetical protein